MSCDATATWAALQEPAGLETIDKDTIGDLMPYDEFLGCVESGGFIDEDGYGFWASSSKFQIGQCVKPSYFRYKAYAPPKWASHVLWLNK